MSTTIEELYERLEDARGSGNTGSIEDAIWAIAEHEKQEVNAKVGMLESALKDIAKYDRYGKLEGICPYGCDCPRIAQEALKLSHTFSQPPRG